MPFGYTLDRHRQRITVIWTDPTGLSDLLEMLARQAADGAWAYGVVQDSSHITWTPTTGEVRLLLDRVALLSVTHGARGPVAIITARPEAYGMARMYGTLGEHPGGVQVQVFHLLAEAEDWLDTLTPPQA